MTRVLTALLCAMFVASPALADDELITTLEEGDPAPFAGTLLNPAATARILAADELKEAQCNARVTAEVAVAQAEAKRDFDILQAQLDSCLFLSNSRLELLQNQNEYLLVELEKQKKVHHGWWFAAGTVVGSALVVGVVYALTPSVNSMSR